MEELDRTGKAILYVAMVVFTVLFVKGIPSRELLPDIIGNKQFEYLADWNIELKEHGKKGLPAGRECKDEDGIHLSGRLPERVYEQPSILLASTYKNVKIKLGDDIIYQFQTEEGKKVTRMVYLLIDIPAEYQGKKLSIEGVEADALFYRRIPPVILGERYEIVYHILLKELPWLFNGVFLCILGVIFVIVTYVLKFHYKITVKETAAMSRASIFAGGWMITECRMFTQLFNHFIATYYINYLCFYFAAIYFMDFLADTGNARGDRKLKQIKKLFLCIFLIGTLGECILSFGYWDLQPLMLSALILGYGMAAVILVINYKQNENKIKVLMGLLFFVTVCIDAIFLYQSVYKSNGGIILVHAASAIVILYILIRVATFFVKAIQEDLLNQALKIHLNVQVQHYKDVLQAQKDLSIYRHDSKNRLLSIYTMLEQGKVKEAKEFITFLIRKIETAKEFMVLCSPALDAILNEKKKEAQKKGIRFLMEIEIPEDIRLDSDDWISVMGNLLDNAIEACERMFTEEKEISVSIKYQKGLLCIRVINSIPGGTIDFMATSKAEHEGHGFGLLSVKKIAKKYNGSFKIEIKKDHCVAEVIIKSYWE